MRAALYAFQEELATLRQQLLTLDLEGQLLAKPVSGASDLEQLVHQIQTHVEANLSRKRRFDYNSTIISLYGFFEQFIEAAIRSYVDQLNRGVEKYIDCPNSLLKNHLDLSFRLINHPYRNKSGRLITENQIVANLHSCLNSTVDFKLNADAFTLHTANFRLDVIDHVFARISVESISRKAKNTSRFRAFFEAKYPERVFDTLRIEDIYELVNDLAERRNEVAHGLSSNVLNNEMLRTYVDFIEEFVIAICEVLENALLPYAVRSANLLGIPIAVYNNSVICFDLPGVSVSVGDKIIVETKNSNEPYVGGEVLEIQVERVSYPTLVRTERCIFALKVNVHAKKNHKFYLAN